MHPARILIADPLELVAEGVRSWLRDESDLLVVGHVCTGGELLEQVMACSPDIILLEVSLPGLDGIDSMRRLRNDHPGVKVLAHSALTGIEYVNSMRIEGAAGYLVKGGPRDELVMAIRTVLAGNEYLSTTARHSVEQGYTFTEKRMDGEYIGLTTRERAIIRLVALERTNAEISAELFISEDTVKTHRKNLMTKLNVRSTAGLVKYAIDRRWV